MSSEQYNSAFTGQQIDEAINKVQNQAPILAGTAQTLTEAQKVQARKNIGALAGSNITLGLHTDGLIYVFVDGAPVGNGVALPSGSSGDVVGNVDSANNIVLAGNLGDGTYTVKYEMADGSTIDIGELVLDSNVYYSITNSLTNCTNSNGATQAISGQAYTATITADSGYELASVTVTMGGMDISASAVSGGSISIAEVTGNIVITAVAEEIKAAEPVTVDIALTDGIRIGSDGGDRTIAGFCATEMIDLRSIPKPCTIHLTKAKWASDGTTTTVRYYVANASGSALANGVTTEGSFDYFTVADNSSNYSNITVTVTSDNVGYIRFSGQWGISGVSDSTSKFADAGTKATLTYTPAS